MGHKKTFIIAEAGVNHNGSLELAVKMIEAAVDAGVDAVKFQTFKAERLVSKYAQKAEYQEKPGLTDESQLEMLKKLELDGAANKRLMEYCEKKNIIFLSSPFDPESIDLLNELGLNLFKIPSGEITNLPYLRKIGALRKEIILSTGMSDLVDIRNALDILTSSGSKLNDITVLHCNTEYPTPVEDVNLNAMLTIQRKFPDVNIGYSDHTLGIEISIAAVALGATIIEKHFTLDKNMDGPDHKASLEPSELKAMVGAIRKIEKALGRGIKEPSPSEQKNRPIARKSIVAVCNIQKGEMFTDKNIGVKRPGTGISPMLWDETIGKISTKEYHEDDLI